MNIKRSKEYILKDMAQMESILSKRDVKYRRNFNRYANNGNRLEDVWTVYGQIISYYTPMFEEIGNIPYLNILRSAVDTTASKLSQTKVRPFFNPVLGTYKTVKTCRNAQIFFDEYYDKEKIYQKAVNSMTDALIFDMGVAWIDDETHTVKHIAPWQFFFDLAEMTNGKLTKCEYQDRNYPLVYLANKLSKDSNYIPYLETNPSYVVTYKIYWDLINKMKYEFINNDLIKETKINYSVPPFVWIYYKDPVKGAFSDSMIDVIYRIQRIIDTINNKISTAADLSPANMVFVPRGSDVKTSMVAASRIGDVFEYNLAASGGQPVMVVTPPVIDPMYLQLLEMYEMKAYNMVGVSQLSAQSKKPSGLNSGVALQTLEDVESERHNVLLGNYMAFIREIAERVIEVFDEKSDVLPRRRGRSAITWKEIKTEREMFNIQFSSASSLSKDPKVKMEQIEKLIGMGFIDKNVAGTLLEMPDLESAYSINTASYDMNEKIIERVIEDGPNPETGMFNFYEITNIQMLLTQSMNTMMRLDANDEKPEVLENLVAFINQLKTMMDEINAELAPPPPPEQAPEQLPPPPEQMPPV